MCGIKVIGPKLDFQINTNPFKLTKSYLYKLECIFKNLNIRKSKLSII